MLSRVESIRNPTNLLEDAEMPDQPRARSCWRRLPVRLGVRMLTVVILVAAPTMAAPRPATALEFDRVVIDDNFPGAYQVEVADVNGDGRVDVVALGGGTCAWYENPSWKKRIVTTPEQTPGIISTATADLDGDGKAEIAIAYEFEMNEPKKGKLLLAIPGDLVDDPWTLKPSIDLGSIHRIRWVGSRAEKGRAALIVAPIFGPDAKPPAYDQSPAHLQIFTPGF